MYNVKKGVVLPIRKTGIICGLFMLAQLFSMANTRIPSEKPKIIIGITIDQMRYDYITYYWDDFSEDGFKKLIQRGTNFKNARYNYLYTQSASGHATIATGANPAYHGIISDDWFNRIKEEMVHCVEDKEEHAVGGFYDSGKKSPKRMFSTTFSDELKISSQSASKVFSVSLKPETSILSTGHMGDAAYWFDEHNGKWMTSSYYMDSLPDWVEDFNQKKFPDLYMKRTWQPLKKMDEGITLERDTAQQEETFHARMQAFKYDLHEMFGGTYQYRELLETPFGNTLTIDFALAAMHHEELGMDEHTDYCHINFATNGYIGQKYGQHSMELRDCYIRLDRIIAHLVDFVERNIGKENALIYLTADRGAAYSPEQLKNLKIPSDYFDLNKAIVLLKSYLNVLYGQGYWIQAYDHNQVYLNRNLIEDSRLSLKEVQDKTAQFIIQFSGIANALTSTALEYGNFSTGIYEKFQNSYNQKRSGDILINLAPGWIEKGQSLTFSNTAYAYDTHVPLIWYGWKVGRNSLSQSIDMKDIAPTISQLLEISYPSASTGKPIEDLLR